MNIARTLLWLLFALLMAAPVKAAAPFIQAAPPLTPTPAPEAGITPNDLSLFVQSIERAIVTTQANQTGAQYVLDGLLVLTILALVWRMGRQREIVNPALVNVVGEQNKRIEDQDDRLNAQQELLSRSSIALESLAKTQTSVHQLLEKQNSQSGDTTRQMESLASAVSTLVNQGSEPMREAVKILNRLDQDQTSERVLQSVDNLKSTILAEIEGFRQEFAAVFSRIENHLAKRKTGPIPPVQEITNGQTTPDTQTERNLK